MNACAFLRVFVAICMVAALLVGPAAAARTVHGAAPLAAKVSADGMDCCPKGAAPEGMDCRHCPLMAICATMIAAPGAPFSVFAPLWRAEALKVPANEPTLAGRYAPPLRKPPRSSV